VVSGVGWNCMGKPRKITQRASPGPQLVKDCNNRVTSCLQARNCLSPAGAKRTSHEFVEPPAQTPLSTSGRWPPRKEDRDRGRPWVRRI